MITVLNGKVGDTPNERISVMNEVFGRQYIERQSGERAGTKQDTNSGENKQSKVHYRELKGTTIEL